MRFVKAVLTFVSRAEGLVVSWTSGYPSRLNNFIVSCAEGGKPPSSSPGTTSAPPTAGARGSVACVIPRDQLRTRILYTVYMEYTTIHMLLEFGQLVESQYQFRQDVATSVWLTHNSKLMSRVDSSVSHSALSEWPAFIRSLSWKCKKCKNDAENICGSAVASSQSMNVKHAACLTYVQPVWDNRVKIASKQARHFEWPLTSVST